MQRAGETTLEDLLACQGLLIGTPENFGTMAGMVKDFFDRTYYPAEGKTVGLPYALFVSAGNDGTGAVTQIDRIAIGYGWKRVAEPLIARNDVTEADLAACEELGEAMASGVALGDFLNVPFAYYARLSAARQRIYDRSDAIERIDLPDAAALRPFIAPAQVRPEGGKPGRSRTAVPGHRLRRSSASSARRRCALPCWRCARATTGASCTGLYLPEDEGRQAVIKLWMRTAKNQRVVAFRSFLRTLLHELCHHLDYEHYKLEETFHTEGFYKRESSLFHQLVPKAQVADV
ncbi:MAG: NAD(P)H-dependent oxidoreductase [Rhodocyclaceae bacterium]|nr:NAD(P)H-dependent oxidoreductase [Rhodocyclaceae bacterium]